MLRRIQFAGQHLLREAASIPVRLLGKAQRGLLLKQLSDEMISKVSVPNGDLKFVASTPLLEARARSVLSKEPDTIRWIDSFEPSDVFWDVGANVGVFGLYAACSRGVQVLAFEPSADNYEVLCRNVEINDFAGRITSYCVAFAGRTELGVLNLASRQVGSALHQFGQPGASSPWSDGNNAGIHGMLGFTIDDFIRQFNPPFPTRLKLDVDGLEWPILQGAVETLHDARLKSAMVELSLNDVMERDRSIAWLSNAGLVLRSRGEEQSSGKESGANHFFGRVSSD